MRAASDGVRFADSLGESRTLGRKIGFDMGKHFSQSDGNKNVRGRGTYVRKSSGKARPVGFNSYADGGSMRSNGWQPIEPERENRHVVAKVIAVILLLLVAIGGVTGFRLYRSVKSVKADAQVVMDSVDQLKESVKSGDAETTRSVASNMNISVHNIQNELDDPAWTIASFVPVLGDDVRSVRKLGDVLVDLSDNAIAPLAINADEVNLKNLVKNGSINVEALESLSDVFATAAPVVTRDAEAVQSLPDAHLPQVAGVLDKAKEKMGKAASAIDKANSLLPILPDMLGKDGQTRNYLLIAQNNVEIRSTGGFYGSWCLVTVTDGHISLTDSKTLQNIEPPAGTNPSVSGGELAAFGPSIATNPGSTGFMYDFSRAGNVAAQFWQALVGGHIDGTIAVDPVFLQRLLALTGGVTTSNGVTVDGSNAAAVLMHDSYWTMPSDQTDLFFAEVAALSFNKLTSDLGGVNVKDLYETLNSSMDDGRLQVWMANENEEAAMKAIGASGQFTEDKTPTVGFYMNNVSFSKIEWYLKSGSEVSAPTVNADGSRTFKVTTSLTNMLDSATAAGAPDYVLGGNQSYDKTNITEWLYIVAPSGGTVSNVAISDGSAVNDLDETLGISSYSALVSFGMGQTLTVTYDVTIPAGAGDTLNVHMTPTAQESAGW